jgi:hypothetical protein
MLDWEGDTRGVTRGNTVYFPSVTASSLQGIDRSFPFMAQSIAYEPETCLKEGNFSGPVLGPTGGV